MELIGSQQYNIYLWNPCASQCLPLTHIGCSVNDYRTVELAKNKTPEKCLGVPGSSGACS